VTKSKLMYFHYYAIQHRLATIHPQHAFIKI